MVLEILYGLVASLITVPFVVVLERRVRSDVVAGAVLLVPAAVFFVTAMIFWEAS